MLKLELLCVGRVKENGLNKLIDEYCWRIGFFSKIKIIELPKLKNSSKDRIIDYLNFDEKNIFKQLDFSSFKIALCVEGNEISSEQFAAKISRIQNLGFSKISFLIGGAFGLSEKVKETSNFKLSLSKMTLPHQLARLFLVEQLYRVMSILNGSSYHK